MDDLNDLVWTSPPSSTNKQPLPNSSRTGSPFSSFDMLANTSNRSYSPSPSFTNAPSSSSNLKPSPAAPAPRSAASSDAFASLLSLGGSNGSSSNGLSMAEKAAKLADEARRKKEAEAKAFAGQGAFWDKFGGGEGPVSLGAPIKSPGAVGGGGGGGLSAPLALPQRISSPSLVPSRPTSSASNNSRPAFSPSISNKTPTPLASPSNDLWSEFDSLSSPPLRPSSSASTSISSKPPPPKATDSSFDSFDLFEDLTVTSKPSSSQLQPPASSSRRSTPTAERNPRTLTPGDHDFGNREDRDDDDGWGGEDAGGLLGGNESEDDDFMGAFNQKPKPSDSRSRTTTSNSSSQPPPPSSSRRPASPPPHILGQIVEMGFSLSQARNALASTPSGLDVQVALEMLISESQTSAPPPDEASRGFESDEERSRREEEEAAERRRRRRRGPARGGEAAGPSSSSAAGSGASTPLSDSLSAAQIQDQASKLLASTNLLGQSMFNRANAFWKEGKTQVQKAYEERQKAAEAAAGGAGKAVDGRPKWMVDAEAFEAEERGGGGSASNGGGGGFRDGDDEEEGPRPSRSNGKKPAQSTELRSAPRQQREQPQVASTSAASKVASLFGDDEPVSHVAPNRRRPAPSTSTSNGSSRAQPSSVSRSSTPAPLAAPLRKRDIVSSSPSALETATSHRTKGNDHFKLGRFGDAEAAYTSAIDSLPSGHLRLLPLLNNRAAARLKNGDHSGSAADSTAVINLVGLDYHPSKEHPLPSDLADLQLGEALVKALSKRAAASEMGEKWEKAREDWDLLGKLDVGGAAGQAAKIPAMDGARRCRKMTDVMNGKKETPPAPSSRPPPPPKPSSHAARRHPTKSAAPPPPPPPSSTKPSEALSRLQATNEAQESEDLLRSQLKDSVEARLLAWKTNKETNIRALIASLDSILWPELGWVKVGMHELVMDKQVKMKYTRAIAKVHPDKLNAGNTTVEQRMIAGGVFGVLNEAWNASQN